LLQHVLRTQRWFTGQQQNQMLPFCNVLLWRASGGVGLPKEAALGVIFFGVTDFCANLVVMVVVQQCRCERNRLLLFLQ